METNGKTFRYSTIFKNLAVLYLIFLAAIIAIAFFGRDVIFLICLSVVVGIGIVSAAIYLANSVSISDEGITTKTLLGTKSLKWSEVSSISSQGSSLKLHNRNGDITLSINPRLDSSVEIFDLIFSKRADLFDAYKHDPFPRSFRSNVITFAVGLLLIGLSLLLYYYKNYLYASGLIGLLFCLLALLHWYTSPRSITLENNRLIVNYRNKSMSYSAGDIAAIQILTTQQNQFKSVVIVFRDQRMMEVSGFRQTPFIIYPVLKQWHEKYAEEQPATYT